MADPNSGDDWQPSRFEEFEIARARIGLIYRNQLLPFIRPIFGLAGFVSGIILILDVGFYFSAEYNQILFVTAQTVLTIFVIYELLGWLFCESSFSEYYRLHRAELVLALLVGAQLLLKDVLVQLFFSPVESEKTALLLMAISQFLFFINSLLHASRRAGFLQHRKIHPSVIFMQSFTIVILIGTALLAMPKSTRLEVPLVDLLFTAVSATCVTGLTTIDVGSAFTRTGQIVLLSLIQIGGLGLMTLTSFFSFYLAGRASLTQQVFMKALLSEDSIAEVRGIIRSIAIMTLSIEAIGAVNLYYSIPMAMVPDSSERLFIAIFTSISAFCNAGFSLFSDNLYTLSIQSPYSIYTTMLLVVIGGLGFPVLRNMVELIGSKLKKQKHRIRLEFTSKLVIIMTSVLLVIGFVFFLILERHSQFASILSTRQYVLQAIIYSVTPRTAGFSAMPFSEFGIPLTVFTLLLMWIGASPVSTGGGIKTTTIAVTLIHLVAVLRGKSRIELFFRTISESTIIRAYSTVLLSLVVVFLGSFLLAIFEQKQFIDLIFEVVSAYATAGLSRGITSDLTVVSKLILCAIMLMGRVGILTFFMSIVPAGREERYQYPSEYIVVG
ncbi:MAG: portal protein [Leptonema sp. (in: Bacteria)]|nr:portal protein [Leptonema sp. (in: bacteria)]